MQTVLDHAGNSNTAQRIALVKRYLKLFDVSCVRMLLADREFIGQEWLVFLADAKVPFAIRLKEDQIVRTQDGRLLALKWLLRRGKGVRSFTATLPARDGHRDLELHFGARRIKVTGIAHRCFSDESKRGPHSAKLQKAVEHRMPVRGL